MKNAERGSITKLTVPKSSLKLKDVFKVFSAQIHCNAGFAVSIDAKPINTVKIGILYLGVNIAEIKPLIIKINVPTNKLSLKNSLKINCSNIGKSQSTSLL